MTGKTEECRARTKEFALRIMNLCRALPKTDEGRTIGRQLLRSGTSVGANYRAVVRARSRPEFIAKLGVVVEEVDETVFWLELIVEGRLMPKARLEPLLEEARGLLAIFAAAQFTAKQDKDS